MKNPKAVLPEVHRLKSCLFPVIYHEHIYFMSSFTAREHFEANPEKYVSNTPPLPGVPVRLVILGPPKSGKSESIVLLLFSIRNQLMLKFLTSCKEV